MKVWPTIPSYHLIRKDFHSLSKYVSLTAKTLHKGVRQISNSKCKKPLITLIAFLRMCCIPVLESVITPPFSVLSSGLSQSNNPCHKPASFSINKQNTKTGMSFSSFCFLYAHKYSLFISVCTLSPKLRPV